MIKSDFNTCFLTRDKALEMAEFYTDLFPDSEIHSVTKLPDGSVMAVDFSLNERKFMSVNGPDTEFTDGISFVISCENQDDIDKYWNHLTDGGKEIQCGWLKDKFGVSWQVIPEILPELMSDPKTAQKVMQAFMPMKKLDLSTLIKAANN